MVSSSKELSLEVTAAIKPGDNDDFFTRYHEVLTGAKIELRDLATRATVATIHARITFRRALRARAADNLLRAAAAIPPRAADYFRPIFGARRSREEGSQEAHPAAWKSNVGRPTPSTSP